MKRSNTMPNAMKRTITIDFIQEYFLWECKKCISRTAAIAKQKVKKYISMSFENLFKFN
ncbi:MAG: hypothetical protein IK005_12150 [Paludibacteraceae bacterium]|nr:hypothetical protein [Paludibacteraceae bacterium]